MVRNVKIGIILSILLLAAVAGAGWYAQKKANDKILKVVERNITPDDRKVFEGRISDLQAKLQASNDNAEKYNLYLQLGQNKYILGLLQESKDYLNEAIKINSDQYDVYLALFLTEFDMRDFEGAEKSIKKAISIRKGIADLWRRHISLKIDTNASKGEVIAIFDQAIKDIQQNGDALNTTDIYTFYATWLEKSGNLAGSIDYWKKAIDVNPANKKVYEAEIKRIEGLIK